MIFASRGLRRFGFLTFGLGGGFLALTLGLGTGTGSSRARSGGGGGTAAALGFTGSGLGLTGRLREGFGFGFGGAGSILVLSDIRTISTVIGGSAVGARSNNTGRPRTARMITAICSPAENIMPRRIIYFPFLPVFEFGRSLGNSTISATLAKPAALTVPMTSMTWP